MSSATSAGFKEIIEEVKANFSVVQSTFRSLQSDLEREEFQTSYVFISGNIAHTNSYIRNEIELLSKHAKAFENTCLSSDLQLSSYKGNPEIIFEYRDGVREFADDTRRMTDSLYMNIGKTLAAYIIVYETLEKFGFGAPFVLVESNEFLSQNLCEYIFDEFDTLGYAIEHRPSKAQIITYSSLDITDPFSLLIIGHESFHIIDRLDGVFSDFCKAKDFIGDKRSLEAFVDIMSNLYFGPVYTVAMQRYFQKRYPLSGETHPEMNIRLLILSYLQSVLGYDKLIPAQKNVLNNFLRTLERRMSQESREKAKADQKRLDSMLEKGVIGYIREYFKRKGVSTYDKFRDAVEARESASSLENLNRSKIRFMLKNEIPVAARPVTLLNTLNEQGSLELVEPRLIVASVKKWYVKRYYQKSIERNLP